MELQSLSILLSVAAAAGIISKFLRQPLLIGYLLAGLVLALSGIGEEIEVFSGLGQIGVTLLLFLVGIEMNLKELPTIGKTAVIAGLAQIFFTSSIGFVIALFLGFGTLQSIYIAVALTFSSTIIIVKLLSEKNDLDSLYGRISVGFLLVQDLVAVLILVFLAGIRESNFGPEQVAFIIIKALILLFLVWLLSKKVFPIFFDKYFASSQELLFISSIAWALGAAALVEGPFGFSLEIGGFLAGLALSNLPEHLQIASRTRPLRDFFLTIFFISLGTKLIVGDIFSIAIPAIIFSAFVLIGNPLILLTVMGALGYKRRTSFLSGLTVAQISEFSLILMAMGASLGHVLEEDVATIILVAVITMTISTYMVLGGDSLYLKIKNYLKIFEKKNTIEANTIVFESFNAHTILVGADTTGTRLIPFFEKKGTQFIVVDFDPEVIKHLKSQKTQFIFGDIGDPEILEILNLNSAKLIVSTISSLNDNLVLLEKIKLEKSKALTIFTAKSKGEAQKYYAAGVNYTILPEKIAGDHVRHILKNYGISKKIIKLGESHKKRLI